MNVLLLNPPGDRIYCRSYYCSGATKASYLFHPLDLLMMSGRAMQNGRRVEVLDAIAGRLDAGTALDRAAAANPDAVIFTAGQVTWDQDREFLARLKERAPGARFIGSGDVFFGDAARIFADNPWLDAACYNFTSPCIGHYLDGAEGEICEMAFRTPGGLEVRRDPQSGKTGRFSLPTPRHDLFRHPRYTFPFARSRPYATTVTTFGCPYPCRFCIGSTLNFSHRGAGEILEELRFIRSLGIREIFFDDYTFGLPAGMAEELCRAMKAEGFGFGWTCFSRVELAKGDLLPLMREAGCHTIIYGVETANEDILKLYRKDYRRRDLLYAFKRCRELGIRTVGAFILGLPEESKESCLETIRFARELDCDFASFNVAMPRHGTDLREQSVKDNLISAADIRFDQGGEVRVMGGHKMTAGEILELKRHADRSFYGRPSYIWRRLKSIRTWEELRRHALDGAALLTGRG